MKAVPKNDPVLTAHTAGQVSGGAFMVGLQQPQEAEHTHRLHT